ncbi:hypothetical protein [uncultured Winogradskyella sp.]|uniref:hypothetical protein n=1 Tax=uncultured Winogradskyella sp. TaxID=395353 RepID=UPI002609F10E|nr:hypothetical protein [uncultured Winogradskyella sp.]|tara:strand:- start:13135 stop:13446 length:312 start_codon:yes stop_codon:yes gene_type:complete
MSGRRRHSTGFGYIGFGNSQATFNRKSSTPFSKYKEKLDLEAHLHYEMDFLHIDLTKEDKQKIKDKIRRQEQQLLKRTLFLSIIVFIIIAAVAYYLFTKISSH